MRSHPLFLSALVLSCATVAPRPAPTAHDAPAAARAAAQSVAGSAKAPVESVDLSEVTIVYRLDAKGLLSSTWEERYTLLSSEPGEAWTKISVPWRPWYQARPSLSATVTDAQGTAFSLNPSTVVDGPEHTDENTFSDGRVLEAPLPGLGRGARVVRTTSRVDTRPPLTGAGRLLQLPVAWPLKVRHLSVSVEAPVGVPLKVESANLAAKLERTERGGVVRYTYEARDVTPPEQLEGGVPPEERTQPLVWVSTGESWAQVAATYQAQLAPLLVAPGLGTTARALVSKGAAPEEKVAALAEWLHKNVRYTEMALSDGTLVPRAPEETVARGYGDCKDMAVLMVAMLREVGLPAEVALLSASDGPDVPQGLPGFGAFNHAIVRVDGKRPIWFDPTSWLSGPNLVPHDDAGRLALRISSSTRGLERVVDLTSADTHRVLTFDFTLAPYGRAHLKRTEESMGMGFASSRGLAITQPDKYDDVVQRYYQDAYKLKAPPRLTHSDPTVLRKPFVQTAEFEVESARTWDREAQASLATSLILDGFPISLEEPKHAAGETEKDTARRARYRFSLPFSNEVVFHIVPPPGYAPVGLPKGVDAAIGPAHFTASYAVDPAHAVTIRLKLDTGPRTWAAADIDLAHAALVKAFAEVPSHVTFENEVLVGLEKGQVKQALARARQLVDQSPRSGVAQVALARALLAAHAGGPARTAAKRAVELEPGLASAHRCYGDTLRRNDLAELYAKGADRTAALRELEEARRLEPDSVITTGILGTLYEYNDQWQWLARGADLRKALEVYEAFRKETEGRNFDDRYARLLFRLGLHQRLVDEATRIQTNELSNGYYLASLVVRKGGAAGFEEAQRTFTEKPVLASAVTAAFSHLLEIREYAKGRELLFRMAEALGTTQQLAKVRPVLERMRQVPRVDRPADARQVVLEFFRSLFEDRREATAALIFPAASATQLNELKKTWAMVAHQVHGAYNFEAVEPDVVLDLFLAAAEWKVAPIEGVGEVVSFVEPMRGSEFALLVVTVDGKKRLHLANLDKALYGKEALARARAGDVKHARAWLEVARRTERKLPRAVEGLLEKGSTEPQWVALAAAALAVTSKGLEAPDAFKALEAAMAGETRPKRRELMRDALVAGAFHHDRFQPLLDLSHDFLRTDDEDAGNALQYTALLRLKRFTEARTLAEKVSAARPDDTEWLFNVATAAADERRYDLAQQTLQKLLAKKGDAASALNNSAWYALFTHVDAAAIERAERASLLTQHKGKNELGTLAALYAHSGRVDEALKTLGQLEELEGGPTDESHASRWFVMGRIAEELGLPDEARRHYARVKPDADEPQDDLMQLTARRLAMLDKHTQARR